MLPFRVSSLGLPTDNRLGWKSLLGANALAFLPVSSMANKKSLKTSKTGVNVSQHFISVTDAAAYKARAFVS